MDTLDNIEYGVASNLQYKLTIEHTNPTNGLPLQLIDLYVSLHLKNDLNGDDLFTVVGVYNEDDLAFDFTFTQEQADLLTVGRWYYGFEVRLTNATGKILHRHTYLRKVISTGAKE